MVVRPRHLAREGSFARVVRGAVLGLVVLGLAAPPAAAAPPVDGLRQRVEAVFEAANRASEAGDHVTAAERFAEAVALLPERREHHDGRAVALLDSVRARRRAFAAGGDVSQLCAARELIARYLEEAAEAYGIGAAQMDGPSAAARERQAVDESLAKSGETCSKGQQPETAEPAPAPRARPEPAPAAPAPRRSPRMIAGAASLGVAGGALVVMAVGLGVGQSAEAAGRELRGAEPTRDIDGLVDAEFYRRGRAANATAIAGGVIGAVAAVVGAGLLVAGARSRGRPGGRARLDPGGLGLRLRF